MMTLTELFTGIANAIRSKDGTTATITAEDFPARITAIPSGGGAGDEYCSNAKGLFIPIYINVTVSCEGVDL